MLPLPQRWNWPADFPPDCPPAAAAPADGVYYRIVKTDPPGPDDFLPLYHLNWKLADFRVSRGTVSWCETMGLSIFTDADQAVSWARRVSSLGDLIARLTLEPASGKILPTPRNGNSHHTWWLPDGYDGTRIATVVIDLRRN